MNTYKATFWRRNPQIEKGGYETTRIIEAKSIVSARKKANEICSKCAYGGMTLLDVQMA